MAEYDPLTADKTVDVTISAVDYIVTSFTDNGAAAVEVNFQTSAGEWRGRRMATGERTASMTIEVEDLAQATPAQFATFNYRGQTWVIKNAPRASAGTSAATINLTLGWVSVAA